MHEHDYELIGALAEGALSPEEADRAEAEIAPCEECRADLAAQRAALAAMAEAPPPGLTALESARLRTSVAESIGLADAPATERRRFLPWAGVATAAAVLIAIVIAAPLVSLLSTGDEDAVADIAAAETTVAVAEADELPVESDSAGAADDPEEAATEAPELPALEETTDEDLSSAAGETRADGGLLALGPITLEDLETLRDTFPEQAGLDDGLELRDVTSDEARFLEFGRIIPSFADVQAAAPEACRSTIVESVPSASLIVTTATAEFEGSPVLVVAVFTSEPGSPLILVVDQENCVVLARVGT